MSATRTCSPSEEAKTETNLVCKRRKTSENHSVIECPRKRPSAMTDTGSQKRPIYSSLAGSNGVSSVRKAASPLCNNKPNSAKKLVIKNFERPQLPERYEEVAWAKLREAVVAIQQSQRISTSQEELYQAVENLCSHKMAPQLYENLRDLCEQHVRSALHTFFKYPFLSFVVGEMHLVIFIPVAKDSFFLVQIMLDSSKMVYLIVLCCGIVLMLHRTDFHFLS